jgi:hypothetical protein
VPVPSGSRDLQAAIWAVSLTGQVPDASIPQITALLKRISEEIGWRLQPRGQEK